jgi:hypothetical protein
MKLNGEVMGHTEFYDYVLTYHQEILDNNPKARYYMGLSTWIDPNKQRTHTFGVSTVVGGKADRGFPGYAKRHELWARRGEISIPKAFYLSSHKRYQGADYSNNPILGSSKEPLFDSQFHIAIENVCIRNCFTEKIVDCFMSKTIPIHYGTPNIGDFFNMDGIYECRNVDEMIAVCNGLTEDDYAKRIDAIEDNFARASKFTPYGDTLKAKITEILAENK